MRISISTPSELLKDFDETTKQIGYSDRSKAIQTAMRNLLTDYRWAYEKKQASTGAIIVLYDHSTRGVEDALIDMQHGYDDIISALMHIHLDDKNCLQIIAVRGKADRIISLAKKITAKRGVKQVKLSVVGA